MATKKPNNVGATNEMIAASEAPLTGRGGKNNFGNNTKELVKTEAQRMIAQKLLSETLLAYSMERVKSDEELAQRIHEYFAMCASQGQIPTVEEMSLCTGYSSSTVWDWESGRNKGFSTGTSDIIKKAKDFLKTFDAKLVVSGQLNFLTYCFRAKNYYGMVDKTEHVFIPNAQNEPYSAEDIKSRYAIEDHSDSDSENED